MMRVRPIRNLVSVFIALAIAAACQSSAVTVSRTPVPLTQPVPPSVKPLPSLINPTSSVPLETNSTATQTGPTPSASIDMSLRGKLLLSDYDLGITQIDLATKQISQIFHPPENGFVGSAVLSPDGQEFFLIYSRPRGIREPHYGAASLYTLSGDVSGEPIPLLKEDDYDNYYYSPSWSPDSQSLYYGRLYQPLPGIPAAQPTGYFLDRYMFSSNSTQTLISNVLNVRISSDGKNLFYVSVDPDTTLSNIYKATPEGSNPQSLLPEGENWIINSMALAPDGETLVFSSADDSVFPRSLSWLDKLLGVGIAQAHDVPSDLFIMKVGEIPRQLTHLGDSGFAEDFSPDGQYITFTCGSGTYIIRADGSGQTKISSLASFGGVQWVS